MADKNYVGSGKQIGNYDMINISVCLSDLPKDDMFEYNGKKYIKLTVGKKRKADKYGKTHSVWVNDYKPDEKKDEPEITPDNEDSSLPF